MKKLLIVTLIMSGLLIASLAIAQVYEVQGKKGVYAMGGSVDKYEPYEAKKDDGKLGKLYVFLPEKKEDSKKLYVTDKTKITLKAGATATVAQLAPGAAVQVEYKKTTSDDLLCLSIIIQ